MAVHLERTARSTLVALAAVGSLGLLHCDLAKQEAGFERRSVERPAATAKHEPSPTAPPKATGGGPMTPESSKPEPTTATGISAVERYLDGKGTEVNRFALEGLTYVQGCPYLTQEGVDSVDTLSDLLKKHPEAKVSIESYADDVGSEKANQQLTKWRATVIEKQLVQCGVEPSRIEIAARGEADPIASNDSEDGKAENRRTEIVLHR
jgi:outer membrane protein OmpA-like peptidoglycan-associated protein